MKLLLDNCVWNKSRLDLAAHGHEVVHVDDWPQDPGDEELLRRAWSESRVLVTIDKDFGELAVVHGHPHVGIVRLVEIPARQQGALCVKVLERYGDILSRGAIVTVERGRVRVRRRQEHANQRDQERNRDAHLFHPGTAGMAHENSLTYRRGNAGSLLPQARHVDLRTAEDLSHHFRDEIVRTAEVQYARG